MLKVRKKVLKLMTLLVLMVQLVSTSIGCQPYDASKPGLQIFWKANGKKVLDYIDICGFNEVPSKVTRFEMVFKNDTNLVKSYQIMDPRLLAEKEVYVFGLEKLYFLSNGSQRGTIEPHSIKTEALVIIDPDWSWNLTRIPIIVDSKHEHHLSLVRKAVFENPALSGSQNPSGIEINEDGVFKVNTIIKLEPEADIAEISIDLKVTVDNPTVRLVKVNSVNCNDVIKISSKTDTYTLEFQATGDFSKINNLTLSFDQVNNIPVAIYPLNNLKFELKKLKRLSKDKSLPLLKWVISDINNTPEPLDFTFMSVGKTNICKKYGMQASDYYIVYDVDKGFIAKYEWLWRVSDDLAILRNYENKDKSTSEVKMMIVSKSGLAKFQIPFDFEHVQKVDDKLFFTDGRNYCFTDLLAQKITKKGVFKFSIFSKVERNADDFIVIDGKYIVSTVEYIDNKPAFFVFACFDVYTEKQIWLKRIANPRKDEYDVYYFAVNCTFSERLGSKGYIPKVDVVQGKLTCLIVYIEENIYAYQGEFKVDIKTGNAADIQYYPEGKMITNRDITSSFNIDPTQYCNWIKDKKRDYKGIIFEDFPDGLCIVNKYSKERTIIVEHQWQEFDKPKKSAILPIDDGKTILVCVDSFVYALDSRLLSEYLDQFTTEL